jgi:hypothetical protein
MNEVVGEDAFHHGDSSDLRQVLRVVTQQAPGTNIFLDRDPTNRGAVSSKGLNSGRRPML